jgi:hypothetical protein
MKRLLLFSLLLAALLAGPAFAVAPSTMSYQGVLMDDAGALVPDGDYTLTFKLYTVSAGGVALWTETQSPVAVSRGGFSVILGSVASLLGVPFDVPYWLGITVGAGTELVPRVRLASSPYGLSLRLPFAGGVSSAGPAFAIGNPGGGPAITADPLLEVGTTSSNGTVHVFEDGVVGLSIADWVGYGGSARFFDNGGQWTTRIEPDVNGPYGGYFQIRGGLGSFEVDGNVLGGSSGPAVAITGPSSASYFQTNSTGDYAVQLPPDAISAAEIKDEPGIAQGHVGNSVDVPIGSTMGDIVTVTLTTPADGYIVVEADGQHGLGGSVTASYNYAAIQIDETAGGGIDGAYYFFSGFSAAGGARSFFTYTPVSIRHAYYKTAGTYTFRLEAYGVQNETLYNYLWNPTITATFYPASYGTVTAAVTAEEAGRFSDVQRVVSRGQAPGEATVEVDLVDLRELELRATQLRLQAEQAERRLLEARRARQDAGPASPK